MNRDQHEALKTPEDMAMIGKLAREVHDLIESRMTGRHFDQGHGVDVGMRVAALGVMNQVSRITILDEQEKRVNWLASVLTRFSAATVSDWTT